MSALVRQPLTERAALAVAAMDGQLTTIETSAVPIGGTCSLAAAARLGMTLLVAVALMLPVPATALAADFRAGEDIRVEANEVVEGDLYVAGGQVTVAGRVNGDLVAAGGVVRVTGPVQGSVNAAGGDVSILGPVSGSARLAGGSVTIDSTISGDVLAGASSLSSTRSSSIGRDLIPIDRPA